MAATAIQGIGQANGTGNRDSLYLEIFGGEVLNLLDHKLIMLETFTTKRALAGAKSATFPTYQDASSSYHTPGESLMEDGSYLSNIKIGERLIHADRVLQSSDFIDDLEEKLNHWDHRRAISDKLTTSVAEQVEDTLFRLVAKGSGAASATGAAALGTITDEWTSGTATVGAATAALVYEQIYACAQAFDENNIPRADRYGAVKPGMFYDLLRYDNNASGVQSSVVNKDFIGGQNGDLAMPPLMGLWIGGIFVMMSNGIPTTDNTGSDSAPLSGTGNDYRADMTDTFNFFGWHKDAIGTVRVKEPTMAVDWLPEYLGHLLVVSQSMGHNVLRQEACYTNRVTT